MQARDVRADRETPAPLAQLLRMVLIAGVVAGLGLGLFQFFVAEPVIERAIQLEEQRMAGVERHEEVFSRQTQREGLIVASVVYGVAFGLIFGGVYAYFRRAFRSLSSIASALLLAAVAVWVIAITPAIKYPANPPGVGDPNTVFLRQGAYLAVILANIVGLVVVDLLRRTLTPRFSRWWPPFALAAVCYGLFYAALMLLLPNGPSSSAMPSDLLWRFRVASVGGQLLFWGVLSGAFAYLLRRQEAQHPAVP